MSYCPRNPDIAAAIALLPELLTYPPDRPLSPEPPGIGYFSSEWVNSHLDIPPANVRKVLQVLEDNGTVETLYGGRQRHRCRWVRLKGNVGGGTYCLADELPRFIEDGTKDKLESMLIAGVSRSRGILCGGGWCPYQVLTDRVGKLNLPQWPKRLRQVLISLHAAGKVQLIHVPGRDGKPRCRWVRLTPAGWPARTTSARAAVRTLCVLAGRDTATASWLARKVISRRREGRQIPSPTGAGWLPLRYVAAMWPNVYATADYNTAERQASRTLRRMAERGEVRHCRGWIRLASEMAGV